VEGNDDVPGMVAAEEMPGRRVRVGAFFCKQTFTLLTHCTEHSLVQRPFESSPLSTLQPVDPQVVNIQLVKSKHPDAPLMLRVWA
jgi:hypothetical protein